MHKPAAPSRLAGMPWHRQHKCCAVQLEPLTSPEGLLPVPYHSIPLPAATGGMRREQTPVGRQLSGMQRYNSPYTLRINVRSTPHLFCSAFADVQMDQSLHVCRDMRYLEPAADIVSGTQVSLGQRSCNRSSLQGAAGCQLQGPCSIWHSRKCMHPAATVLVVTICRTQCKYTAFVCACTAHRPNERHNDKTRMEVALQDYATRQPASQGHVQLTAPQTNQLKRLIDGQYRVRMLLEGLPVTTLDLEMVCILSMQCCCPCELFGARAQGGDTSPTI
jgi:hypothetical protein